MTDIKLAADRTVAVANAEKCQRWRNKQRIPKVNSVWALGALAAL